MYVYTYIYVYIWIQFVTSLPISGGGGGEHGVARGARRAVRGGRRALVPPSHLTQSVLKSFGKGRFPQKIVSLFFTLVIYKNKLTDL